MIGGMGEWEEVEGWGTDEGGDVTVKGERRETKDHHDKEVKMRY